MVDYRRIMPCLPMDDSDKHAGNCLCPALGACKSASCRDGVLRLSVAFAKDDSAETAAETHLPDRPISPHPNRVTEAGLKALELELSQARAAYEATGTIDDVNERRRQAATPLRDTRYFAARVHTAEVIPAPANLPPSQGSDEARSGGRAAGFPQPFRHFLPW